MEKKKRILAAVLSTHLQRLLSQYYYSYKSFIIMQRLRLRNRSVDESNHYSEVMCHNNVMTKPSLLLLNTRTVAERVIR